MLPWYLVYLLPVGIINYVAAWQGSTAIWQRRAIELLLLVCCYLALPDGRQGRLQLCSAPALQTTGYYHDHVAVITTAEGRNLLFVTQANRYSPRQMDRRGGSDTRRPRR
jgi:hypothetical protein